MQDKKDNLANQPKIDNRYTVTRLLGGGLSGEVFAVRDDEHEGEVALKFLKKVQFNISREEALQSFKNEFSILSELSHPHIARILDFGFDTRQEKYFFTTELILGCDFFQATAESSIEQIEELAVQVLRAFNYLHSRGVFHLDIKPQNILVHEPDGKKIAKLIDFGLAGFSNPRKKVGTPAYMAPEVILGGTLDGRTDLYSFGVMLYKVLTRTNPFASKNVRESLERHRTMVVKPPSQVSPQVPAFWDRIIQRLLAKNPTDRYPEASAVIRDINFLNNKNYDVETMDTRLSYLPDKGILIARENETKVFRAMFEAVFQASEESCESAHKILVIEGEAGTGKSRLLSEFKYYSQLHNVPVYSWSGFKKQEMVPPFSLHIDSDDDVSVQEISQLLHQYANEAVLIVWATEKAPANWSHATVLSLLRFTRDQLRQYLVTVTGLSSPPENLISGIHERTQGNPLFVSEILKTMLASNMLLDSSGRWASSAFEDIHINFEKIKISQTLNGLLKNRFDALDSESKIILEWFSVFEKPISMESLVALTGFKNIQGLLLNLTNSNIIERTSREQHYYFANLLMGEVVALTMPAEKMARLHDEAAHYIKKTTGDREECLFHLGRGESHQNAIEALLSLADMDLSHDRFEAAIKSTRLAWQRAQNMDLACKIRVETKLAETYVLMRDYKEAIAHYQALHDIYDTNPALSSMDIFLAIEEKLGSLFVKLDELDKARELFEKTLNRLKNENNQTVSRMILENHVANILMKQGKTDEAYQIFSRNLTEWKKLSVANKRRVTNNYLSELLAIKHDLSGAITQVKEDISFYEEIEDANLLTKSYYFLGDLYYRQMLDENGSVRDRMKGEAIEAFKCSIDIAKKIGAHDHLLRSYNGMANLHYVEKDFKSSLEYYERALALARSKQEFQSAAVLTCNMGNIFKILKNYSDAYSHFIYAINTLENTEPKNVYTWLYLFNAHVELSETLRDTGELEKARETLEKAQSIVCKHPSLENYQFWVHLEIAKTEFKLNNKSETEKYLALAESEARQAHEQEELSKFKAQLLGQSMVADAQNMDVLIQEEDDMNAVTKYETILQINKFINSEHNPELLLKMVLNYALELSGAETGMVLLVDDNGEFELKATANTPKGSSLSDFSTSVARQVLQSGKEAVIADALADERFTSSESIVLSDMKSVLCLPIRSKNRAIGVFYLDNRFKTDAFMHADMRVLNAFCDQVGIALENARLISGFEAIKNQLEQKLAATSEELNTVKERLDVEISTSLTKFSYDNIISQSEPMREIFHLLDKITETNLAVYLFGASGTGKELIARALHYNNKARAGKRFIAINCGAIPPNLIESELFGYKAGAFTGAVKDKKGLFEEASGGTLFLDEIGELDLSLQVKLLRVLQEGEVRRIGDTHSVKVDVRVVCASHRDITKMIADKTFREDLFYRLCQITVAIPALAERREDIPLLAEHFIAKYRTDNKTKEAIKASPEFMRALLAHNWPGNIRELENLISVACALRDGDLLTLSSIPPTHALVKAKASVETNVSYLSKSIKQISHPDKQVPIDEKNIYNPSCVWEGYEALIMAACFKHNDFKKNPTADMLGVSPSTFYKKIKDYDLDNTANPLYAENFWYNPALELRDYVPLVFQASLTYCDNHPYAAIKILNVSQGYFYKILKQIKEGARDTATGA